jgi:hypothetical protein
MSFFFSLTKSENKRVEPPCLEVVSGVEGRRWRKGLGG